MSAWDNIVENFKNIGNGNKNSSKFINTQQALYKNGTYKPNFILGGVSAPNGQPSSVFAGYGGASKNVSDQQPNFMNLVLLGLGAFLIIKILD